MTPLPGFVDKFMPKQFFEAGYYDTALIVWVYLLLALPFLQLLKKYSCHLPVSLEKLCKASFP